MKNSDKNIATPKATTSGAAVRHKSIFKDTKRSLFLLSALVIFILLFYCIASLFTSVGYETFLKARDIENRITAVTANNYKPLTIIIDPGHGGEDPGAVANGVREKDINISVANKLYEMLSVSGYNVVMTRTEDILLYDRNNEAEIRNKKHFDLVNRLKVIQAYENCIYVGIHMNKFPIAKYNGFQTFYSSNDPASKNLALSVQSSVKLIQKENKRLARDENHTIYILEYSKAPSILVECGFLSNPQEAVLLSADAYQNKIAFTIFHGITNYLGAEENG